VDSAMPALYKLDLVLMSFSLHKETNIIGKITKTEDSLYLSSFAKEKP
jgi:hypothetical protein